MLMDDYAYQSGMRKVNARLKVLFTLMTLCLLLVLDRVLISLFVAFSMSLVTLWAGKIPWRIYGRLLLPPLAFLLLSGAAIAVEFTKSPVGIWHLTLPFFCICVTGQSLHAAGCVFLKAFGGLSVLFMLTLSTPVSEVVLALQKLHLPAPLAELMNLIYRYLFILLRTAEQMQTAAKARLGYQGIRRSFRTFAAVAGNLFLISLKKSAAYYDALIARGYCGRLAFLTEEEAVKGWQAALCILYFGVMIGLARCI